MGIEVDWLWVLEEYYGNRLSNVNMKFQYEKEDDENRGAVDMEFLEYLLLCYKYRQNYEFIEIMLKKLENST